MKRTFTFLAVIIFSSLYAQNIWTEVTTPFGIEDFYADKISLVNQDVLWVHGKSTDNTSESEKWGWSDDAGQTWHTGDFTGIDTTASSVCSIAGISSTTAYVSICSNVENYKGIFITTDGGQTWTKQTSASFVDNTCPNIVRFWDNQNGIAIGNLIGYPHPVIYQTFNSGINWIRVPSGNIPSLLDNEFSITDDSFIDQDNICFGTNKGRIFVDILGLGNVWIVTDLPYSISNNTQMNRYFAFANNNDGLLSDLSGNLWKTSDGSISWLPINPAGSFNHGYIQFIPQTTNTYFQINKIDSSIVGNNFGSSYTDDGGLNWYDLNQVDSEPVIPYLA